MEVYRKLYSFGEHIIVIDNNGKVLISGKESPLFFGCHESFFGCHESESLSLDKFSPVAKLLGYRIQSIYFHYASIILLTEDSSAFVLGKDINGCLGLGQEDVINITEPQRLNSPVAEKGWRKFTCGLYHTFGWIDDITIYCWGLGSVVGFNDIYQRNVYSPTLMNHNFVDIVSGSFHCFGVDSNESIFVWGSNCNGQMGIGSGTSYSNIHPFLHPFISKYKIYAISYSSFSVLETGEVYSWGHNRNGQLGLDHRNDVFIPTKVILPPEVKCIELFTGDQKTIITTNVGLIYGWGKGMGDNSDMLSPKSIIKLPIEDIIVGKDSIFNVTDGGNIHRLRVGEEHTQVENWRLISSKGWNPRIHKFFDKYRKRIIRTIIMVNNRNNVLFHLIPRDIIYRICEYTLMDY